MLNKITTNIFFIFSIFADINTDSKIYLAGHRGLVGNAILQKLQGLGYKNIIYKTSKELDLKDQKQVENFFENEKPEYVILCAAKVGGIQANINNPALFFYDNLAININVINSAYKNNVKKLLFLGSSCMYPRNCPQPMKEDYILTSPVEPTNEYYALAKVCGAKLCEAYNKQYKTNFIFCAPPNVYGPGDNFDPKHSHVISGLIRKFIEAKNNNFKRIKLWGTGSARREFIYVDDLADACVFLLNNYNANELINTGTGKDISIKELAEKIKIITEYQGDIEWDHDMPDGMPQKLMDSGKLNNLGWKSSTDLDTGIQKTIEWYKKLLIKG